MIAKLIVVTSLLKTCIKTNIDTNKEICYNFIMKYKSVLDKITSSYIKIIDENLVGIYLHGSLAMGCFTENSDIDLLVIIEKPMSFSDYRKLINVTMDIKNTPAKGIELSLVLKKYCFEFEYPIPFELHYSIFHKDKYQKDDKYICGGFTDKDLAAHFMVTQQRGICLSGTPINQVFASPISLNTESI